MITSNNAILLSTNLNNEDPAILSVTELAELLKIGKNRAYDLLNSGTIKGFRIGCTWRVSMSAVNNYVKEASCL